MTLGRAGAKPAFATRIINNRDDDIMKQSVKDEHVGEQIGIYKILSLCDYKSNDGHKMYNVQCTECGWENDMQYRHIKDMSPTCCHLSVSGTYTNRSQKIQWKNKRLKCIFNGMRTRCYNSNDKSYEFYGKKGIRICDEWLFNPLAFEEWSLNNGYYDGLTIDRIDADKDYCPENCQWLSMEENTRRAGKVNVDDITLTGKQWGDYLHIGVNTINKAIREYGVEKTKELIKAMLQDPPSNKHRKSRQTWFSAYGIQV